MRRIKSSKFNLMDYPVVEMECQFFFNQNLLQRGNSQITGGMEVDCLPTVYIDDDGINYKVCNL